MNEFQKILAALPELSIEHIIVCLISREQSPVGREWIADAQHRRHELAAAWKQRAATDPALARRIARLWLEHYAQAGVPGKALNCYQQPDESTEPEILEGAHVPGVLREQFHRVLGDAEVPVATATPPPLLKQAATATAALAKWAAQGLPIATPEQVEARKAICAGCEFWESSAFNNTGRCLKCGCSTWAKLQLATEKCPIDKWGSVHG
jgi:hypothetical protein